MREAMHLAQPGEPNLSFIPRAYWQDECFVDHSGEGVRAGAPPQAPSAPAPPVGEHRVWAEGKVVSGAFTTVVRILLVYPTSLLKSDRWRYSGCIPNRFELLSTPYWELSLR